MNAYTTIEESKQLIKAGLDVNTHDMFYHRGDSREEYLISVGKHPAITNNLFSYRNDYVIPCWSLAALLEIIPKRLYINNNAWEVYVLVIYLGEKCVVAYQHSNIFMHSEHSDTNVEAVYKMVIWLLENNYIKSNKNE